MKFAFYIARRFMLGGKGSGPSRLNGWIAIAGLTIGTLAMVLSAAVLNGFELRVIQRVIGFEGDLRISNLPQDYKTVFMKLKNENSDIKEILLFQQRRGIILGRNNSQRMVTFKAVDPEKIMNFYDLNMDYHEKSSNLPKFYLGAATARRLNVGLGEAVRIYSPIDQGGGLNMPRQIHGLVGGIFQVKVLDIDDNLVFIPRAVGEQLFVRKSGPDGLDIRLIKETSALGIKKILAAEYPDYRVETWEDMHHDLFSAMRLEKIGALIVLSLIIVVACFNLNTTLILVAAQKIREFGILQTLGTNRKKIKLIILTQGFLIGGTGSLAGLICGIGFVYSQNKFGIISLPEDIYFTDKLPMEIMGFDLLLILLVTLGMILTAAFRAAKQVLIIKPKDALYLEK
ncbi:MAG: FtsX-like permease family protein [Candidatus Neomarinimicrobiota bacterium]